MEKNKKDVAIAVFKDAKQILWEKVVVEEKEVIEQFEDKLFIHKNILEMAEEKLKKFKTLELKEKQKDI